MNALSASRQHARLMRWCAVFLTVLVLDHWRGAVVAAPATVDGHFRYQKILVRDGRLDLGHPSLVAAEGVLVELLRKDDGQVLAQAATDAAGAYRLAVDVPAPVTVYVCVLALRDNIRVVTVEDEIVYSVSGNEFTLTPDGSFSKDLVAKDDNRGSGPFNIVQLLGTANRLIKQLQPSAVFAELPVHWATDYGGETCFRETGAFIKGVRDVDSDEFDDHVVLHEYGHYVARTFSHDDSPGDRHSPGDYLDYRCAWSEGWANFFCCAVLNDPRYVDTEGPGGQSSFQFDLRQHAPTQDHPGPWSEQTAGSTLWSMYADSSDDRHSLALGFMPIWLSLTGDFRHHVFSDLLHYCDCFERANPSAATGVTTILKDRGITFIPGGHPCGENAMPVALVNGREVAGAVDSTAPNDDDAGQPSSRARGRVNGIRSSQFYTFELPARKQTKVALTLLAGGGDPQRSTVSLHVYNGAGTEMMDATPATATHRVFSAMLPKDEYLVEICSWNLNPASGLQYGKATFNLLVSY